MEAENRSHLMGQIIALLDFLHDNQVEIDRLWQADGEAFFSSLPNARAMRAAYENLRFMEEMPGGVLIYYGDGGEEIVYANSALLRIFCCGTVQELRELTGNSFRGLVYPEDLEAVERSIQEQIAHSRFDLDYVEYRIRRRDGEIRWIEDYGHFVRGTVTRDIFYVFLSDATEKRNHRMLEKTLLLQEKDRQLQTLSEEYDRERTLVRQEHLRRLEAIEGLSVNYETILYGDLNGNWISPYRLSSRTSRMFGEGSQMRELDRYLSDYVETWVHPEDQEILRQTLDRMYIHRKLLREGSFYVNYRVLEDGEEKYLQLLFVDVSHGKEGTQFVLGYRRVDEEVRREMERKLQLEEALERADRAMSAKDAFLSNMSHDMRTPLNAIFGFAALAKQNLGAPEIARGYIERMEASGRQLLGMIERVLEISEAVSGESGPEEELCDLCEIVQGVYDFIAPQAEEKEIAFTLDCTGVEHSAIYGDEEKIQQLVMYLTNNAVTYTKPGGRVCVSVSERTEASDVSVYRLEVADTGIGISREFLDRIFEPFSREKDTTHSGVHGIGLGMTIAKNIVDTLGGTMDVQSEVNRGSVFTASFRFRFQSGSSLPAAGGARTSGRLKRILLAEDNEINLEIAMELLQERGLEIEPAANGSIALEKISSSRPGDYSAVLMDIQMPVMDGWQAAQAIRQLPDPALARIPIVALSANVLESDRRKSAQSGMNAHLGKPMDVDEVLKTLEDLL